LSTLADRIRGIVRPPAASGNHLPLLSDPTDALDLSDPPDRCAVPIIESTLGGVFSVLSQELQLPIVMLVKDRLTRQRKVPKLPPKSIRPAIVTGIEALGRGQELARINVATQAAAQIVGPAEFNQYLNVRQLIGAIFSAAGVDTQGLIRTEAEVAASVRQQQMMAMAQRVGPNVVNQLGPGVAERMGLGAGQGPAPAQQAPPPATPK